MVPPTRVIVGAYYKQQEYCYIFAHNYYYQLLHQTMRYFDYIYT